MVETTLPFELQSQMQKLQTFRSLLQEREDLFKVRETQPMLWDMLNPPEYQAWRKNFDLVDQQIVKIIRIVFSSQTEENKQLQKVYGSFEDTKK